MSTGENMPDMQDIRDLFAVLGRGITDKESALLQKIIEKWSTRMTQLRSSRRQLYFITKTVNFEIPVSKKRFLQNARDEIKELYVKRVILIKNKSFSAKKLNMLEKSGKLRGYVFGRKRMYLKSDILKLVKSEARPEQGQLFKNEACGVSS